MLLLPLAVMPVLERVGGHLSSNAPLSTDPQPSMKLRRARTTLAFFAVRAPRASLGGWFTFTDIDRSDGLDARAWSEPLNGDARRR